jgi:hypothetical protein
MFIRILLNLRNDCDLSDTESIENQINKFLPWSALKDEFPGITIDRLFVSVRPPKIRELLEQLEKKHVDTHPQQARYERPNFLNFLRILCPPGEDWKRLRKKLAACANVSRVYRDPNTTLPQVVAPANDPLFDLQGHLKTAPIGIDAIYAWPKSDGTGVAGADGADVGFIDIEEGWVLDRPDLLNSAGAPRAVLLRGKNASPITQPFIAGHGSSVLGLVMASDNIIECVGVAPSLTNPGVVSYRDENGQENRHDAILFAIDHLGSGDVLLLEMQLQETGLPPVEADPNSFDLIKAATDKGIIVVEAAGNDANDLDIYAVENRMILNPSSPKFVDSGAIIVAGAVDGMEDAVVGGQTFQVHRRRIDSNFGNRIDCYAWGQNAITLGGFPFNGTSAASAIVAGAAVLVQGGVKAAGSPPLTPAGMRSVLKVGGTPCHPDDRIGAMPNLREVLTDLGIGPELVIRDSDSDLGDDEKAREFSSPDIIPTLAPEPDPAKRFRNGCRMEDTDASRLRLDTTNYCYVKVANNGAAAAQGKVYLFSGPVSTVPIRDRLRLIGSKTVRISSGRESVVSPAFEWTPRAGQMMMVSVAAQARDPGPPFMTKEWNTLADYLIAVADSNVAIRNIHSIVANHDYRCDQLDGAFLNLPFVFFGLPEVSTATLRLNSDLPDDTQRWLELPRGMQIRETGSGPRDPKSGRQWVQMPENERVVVNSVAGHLSNVTLLLQIPPQARNRTYTLVLNHLARNKRAGRITWRLMLEQNL